jgi:GR25 family glycosyltransferase involved in LPS biosynthesis
MSNFIENTKGNINEKISLDFNIWSRSIKLNSKKGPFPHAISITLDPSGARMQKLKKSMDDLDIENFTYVGSRGNSFNLDGCTLPKGSGAIGCASSHLEVIRMISVGKEEDMLVFEDDANVKDFVDRWRFTWKDVFDAIPSDADILIMHPHHMDVPFLEKYYPEIKDGEKCTTRRCNVPIALPYRKIRSLAAYYIKRSGARKLTNAYMNAQNKRWSNVDLPIDVWMEKQDGLGILKIYTMPILGTSEDMKSSICNAQYVLRMREIGNRALKKSLDSSSSSSTIIHRSTYAQEFAREFWPEMLIGITLMSIGILSIIKSCHHTPENNNV